MILRLSICLLTLGPPAAAQDALPDMSEQGRFARVAIAGLALPITDVQALHRADLLRYNAARGRFGFAPAVTSERRLKRALAPLPLTDPGSVLDLYRSAKVALPRGAGHTLTIPSGFGPMAFGGDRSPVTLSAGVGGVGRVPYTDKADGGASVSLSFGNGFRGLGASLSLSVNDLSEPFDTERMSVGIKVNRYLSDGYSVSFGGENLFVGKTDGDPSGFVALSRAFDAGTLPFAGVWTLGAGSGRFAKLSDRDVVEGRSRDGTVVFGAVGLDVSENVSVMTEWNGRNLAMGVAFRFSKPQLSVTLGVRDLTNASGDGARLMGAIGFTLARF